MTADGIAQRSSRTTEDSMPVSGDGHAQSQALLCAVHSPDAAAVASSVPLGTDLLVVGRDVSDAGYCVSDSRMSRFHFHVAFDRRSMAYRVADAESRNGTYHNGTRIQAAVLRPGDVLRAGDTVFIYVLPDPMEKAQQRAMRVAPSALGVLLLGETGTGKERLARALHENSGRKGRFVAVNCAALPRDLLGAELFGHTRGAFSGAGESRLGLFRAADGGTLFLDEVADFPFELQAALLRVLQEGLVRPLGSDREISVDVRIVSATHADMKEAMRMNRFRRDLFARLAQIIIRVPPLRERRAAILPLAREFAQAAGNDSFQTSHDAAEALVRWSWPFNVRELESLVRGFSAIAPGRTLEMSYLKEHHSETVADFRQSDRDAPPMSSPKPTSSESPDRNRLEELLEHHRGNVSAIAKDLGKRRMQVYRWLKAAGLSATRFR